MASPSHGLYVTVGARKPFLLRPTEQTLFPSLLPLVSCVAIEPQSIHAQMEVHSCAHRYRNRQGPNGPIACLLFKREK